MARRQKLCADCGAGMKYASYVMGNGRQELGFHCLPCGTVTERFGTLDVTHPVAAVTELEMAA